MNYSISFVCFRKNCRHYYEVSTRENNLMKRCKLLTKKEFKTQSEIHNLEGMQEIKCTEGQCPVVNRKQFV